MTDNITPIKTSMAVSTNVERDMLAHVQQAFAKVKEIGAEPKGIAFVVFSTNPDGSTQTSSHWCMEHFKETFVDFALAYAAAQLQQDALKS